jgi:alpha-D-xyloside xylohydrolase
LSAAFFSVAGSAADTATITVEQEQNDVVLHNGAEMLRLTVCGPDVIHIVAGPGSPTAASPASPWIVNGCKPDHFHLQRSEKEVTVNASAISVRISLATGHLTFQDAAGRTLLRENSIQPRRYLPEDVNGEKAYAVSDRFVPDLREGVYGLGQHQSGAFNYRGSLVELGQANTDVAVPLLVSTNGYGIFWNTASRSWFDNRFPRELKLSTDAADALDYYFFYGPEIDQILHHYRELTGHAPLLSKWAYGFVQSKDRYKSAQQLLDIGAEYRAKHVPLDLIVQDWFWWKYQGDPDFDEEYLKPAPDVPGVLKRLHEENFHAMISVWAMLNPKSKTFQEMQQENLLIPGTPDYDPTNPAARELYWQLLVSKVFQEGWDGFWLDSSEPETWGGESDTTLFDKHLFIGNGARYTNIFPFMHTGNIYDHWRQTTDQKRVFILTRSAFAGQQRNSAITWSGDIFSTFLALTRQIPAGLNFAVSGIPYWTTDIGGYVSAYENDTNNPAFQELYARWYEYGAFCPIFRTHGHRATDTNELFSYGAVTPILINTDKLRYRLMPYIYSLAWRVTHEDYTIQRPLIMDWRTNENVRNLGDEFMFGPSILVNPVTVAGASSRWLYLPPAPAWYDFWTGEELKGDQQLEAPAPIERIPLYIRAGAILPMGPEIEYADQKPDTPIELRIYHGADCSFDLYEDEGDTYAYEKGAHASIPIRWNDVNHRLTFEPLEGSYPGMEKEIVFRIVLVDQKHGVGQQASAIADKEVHYTGNQITLELP